MNINISNQVQENNDLNESEVSNSRTSVKSLVFDILNIEIDLEVENKQNLKVFLQEFKDDIQDYNILKEDWLKEFVDDKDFDRIFKNSLVLKDLIKNKLGESFSLADINSYEFSSIIKRKDFDLFIDVFWFVFNPKLSDSFEGLVYNYWDFTPDNLKLLKYLRDNVYWELFIKEKDDLWELDDLSLRNHDYKYIHELRYWYFLSKIRIEDLEKIKGTYLWSFRNPDLLRDEKLQKFLSNSIAVENYLELEEKIGGDFFRLIEKEYLYELLELNLNNAFLKYYDFFDFQWILKDYDKMFDEWYEENFIKNHKKASLLNDDTLSKEEKRKIRREIRLDLDEKFKLANDKIVNWFRKIYFKLSAYWEKWLENFLYINSLVSEDEKVRLKDNWDFSGFLHWVSNIFNIDSELLKTFYWKYVKEWEVNFEMRWKIWKLTSYFSPMREENWEQFWENNIEEKQKLLDLFYDTYWELIFEWDIRDNRMNTIFRIYHTWYDYDYIKNIIEKYDLKWKEGLDILYKFFDKFRKNDLRNLVEIDNIFNLWLKKEDLLKWRETFLYMWETHNINHISIIRKQNWKLEDKSYLSHFEFLKNQLIKINSLFDLENYKDFLKINLNETKLFFIEKFEYSIEDFKDEDLIKSLSQVTEIDKIAFEKLSEKLDEQTVLIYLWDKKNLHWALEFYDLIIENNFISDQELKNLFIQIWKSNYIDRYTDFKNSLNSIKDDWREKLEDFKLDIDDFIDLKEKLLKESPFKSLRMMKKLADLLKMYESQEILLASQNMWWKDEKENKDLYNFASKLLFHDWISVNHVKDFVMNPKSFFWLSDVHSWEAHNLKKPSNYLDFSHLDLTAEELRNAYILWDIDKVSNWNNFEKLVYSKSFREVLLDTIGSIKLDIKPKNPIWWKHFSKIIEIMWWTKVIEDILLNENKTYDNDLNLKNKLFNYLKENTDYKNFWKIYKAEILSRSNPRSVTTWNDAPSCMSFWSWKNNVYMMNPNCAFFAISEIWDWDREDRTVVTSVLTLDKHIDKNANEIYKTLKEISSQREYNQLKISELFWENFLKNLWINQSLTIWVDNIEADKNYIDKIWWKDFFKNTLEWVYKWFFEDYIKINEDLLPLLNHKEAVIWTWYNDYTIWNKRINNFLPSAPIAYTDKASEEIYSLALDLDDNQKLEKKMKKTWVNKLTHLDILEISFIESKVYNDDLRTNLARIENEIIASEINNQVKGRENYSLTIRWKDGSMDGYIIAYEWVIDKSSWEKCIYVSDLAMLEEKKNSLQAWKLIKEFSKLVKNSWLPVYAEFRESTSYKLIKKHAFIFGYKIEELWEYNSWSEKMIKCKLIKK